MHDLDDLRSRARSAPSSLSADEKNWLLAARVGEPITESANDPARLTEPGPVTTGPGVVTEVVLPGNYYDPDDNLGPFQAGTRFMRRLTTTAKRKDLNPLQHERMLKISAYLWDRNPLAARVIKRAVNYVLGEGVTVVAKHKDEATKEKIQEAIDRFWHDHRNKMDRRLLKWCIAWRAYGELALRATVNPVDGKVRLAYISPELIMEVTPEKTDIEQIQSLKISRGPGDTEGEVVSVVRVIEEDQALDTIYDPHDPRRKRAQDRAHGSSFYFATNVLPDMVRGRSDMLAIADVLDGYDQFIWNRMERQALLLAFVWSVELQGMSDDEIRDWMNKNPGVPKPGSIQAHNEKVKWEAVAPSLGSSEATIESDLMLNFIATSQGMPAMWFGENQDPNRANGENLTGPTLKDMTGLQREFQEVVAQLIYFVLDQAVIAGVLPEDLDTRTAFEIRMPELSVRDMATTVNTMSTLANAGALARQYEMLDLETIQELMVLAIGPAGLEISVKELRERVKKDQEALRAQQEEQDAAYGGDQSTGWGEQAQQPQPPSMPPISISYRSGGGQQTGSGPPPDGSERRRM